MMYKSRGFTLIELLVVIAIIAILAAILFPIFTSAQERGRQAVCTSNEHQLGMAISEYTDDYGGRYPVWVDVTDTSVTWKNMIFKYVKNQRIFQCPDQKIKVGTGDIVGSGYGISYWLINAANGAIASAQPYSSRRCMLCENKGDTRSTDKSQWAEVDRSWPTRYYLLDRRFEPDPRHNNGLNMLFCDGHVKWIAAGDRHLVAPAPYAANDPIRGLAGTWWYPTPVSP